MQPWRLYLLGLILLLFCVVFRNASLVTAQSDSLPVDTPTEPVLETPPPPVPETPTIINPDLPTPTLFPESPSPEPPTATATETATEPPSATPTLTESVPEGLASTVTVTDVFTSVPDTPTATVWQDEPTPTASATETPAPVILPTDTAVPTEIPLPTDPAVPTETPLPTATELPTPTALPLQSLATPPPYLLITEFLADPKAVGDEQGEWLELYNADTMAVNLRDWVLADLDSDRHVIATDLWIQPGQYLVLGRNGDTTVNGGVTVAYTYQTLSLANSSDELVLLAPDGAEVDRVAWGDGTPLTVKAGASCQRTALEAAASWTVSVDVWPGSIGDQGTPGSVYQPPAQAPTATPIGAVTPVATPGATWPLATAPSDLQIDEVLYRGSDEEFIVLSNTGATPIDLTGWLVGDAETPGKSEGIYALPTGTLLAAGDLLVLARNGLAFRNQWGRPANAEFAATDADTPDLVRRRDLAKGEMALNDSGDELLLFNPDGTVADAVAFGDGVYSALGLTGVLAAPKGDALHRVPDARFPVVHELRHRFLYAPPAPFTVLPLPTPLPLASPQVDGLWITWGSLGVQSIFSPDGMAPPHYLLATAAAQGWHFLAIADPLAVEPWQHSDAVIAVPAWQWSGSDGMNAILYNAQPQALADTTALLAALEATGSVAQWQGTEAPTQSGIVALAADKVSAPGTLAALYKAWFAAEAPLLPVGNAAPPVPGVSVPAPRYTGLAVTSVQRTGMEDALAHRRGWLTSQPGLWLTLQAQTADGRRSWMGSTLQAANEVTLDVDYGDTTGEVAGVAIWQDDKPIQQLARPLAGGRWTVTLPAMPNSFLYAVATQADGDFAVTAPFYVLPTGGGAAVVINEVLPAPGADHNGDGVINSDDEYIELYNPSDQPVSLAGWQLSDVTSDVTPSRRFTFGVGRYIGGHQYLLLRRTETRINLNNTDDSMRLFNADGEAVDQIAWAQSPRRGHSLSRLPDGGTWLEGNATPGKANQLATDNKTEAAKPPDTHDDEDDKDEDDDEPPPVRLEPTYGQVGGPPASIAQSKLSGLEQWVEFRAVVTAPPGLYNATIYVADPAPDYTIGPLAGIGINVYVRNGAFPPLAEGDRVLVRGLLRSFRGEMELQLESPTQIWKLEGGVPLQPLPVSATEVGETLEGRLVTFTGVVTGWQGDSIFVTDPNHPDAEAVRVTVRSSLPWRRPYVQKGQRWQVTGIVSQFAREAPWNGGYRVLARYKEDLVKLK